MAIDRVIRASLVMVAWVAFGLAAWGEESPDRVVQPGVPQGKLTSREFLES